MMETPETIVERTALFLEQTQPVPDLRRFAELEQLLDEVSDPDQEDKIAPELVAQLRARYAQFIDEAMTRLFSKASGGDITALDTVASISVHLNPEKCIQEYFEAAHGGIAESAYRDEFEHALDEDKYQAVARQTLTHYYAGRYGHDDAEHGYWLHILKRANDKADWAQRALAAGILDGQFPWLGNDEDEKDHLAQALEIFVKHYVATRPLV